MLPGQDDQTETSSLCRELARMVRDMSILANSDAARTVASESEYQWGDMALGNDGSRECTYSADA